MHLPQGDQVFWGNPHNEQLWICDHDAPELKPLTLLLHGRKSRVMVVL